MNKLEKAIMAGARRAQILYQRMTDGHWLWHAPESFLQTITAQHIAKLGFSVYVDASGKKIARDLNASRERRGRPAKALRQRADISVWYKSNYGLRAAIEIKRHPNATQITNDARKLSGALASKGGAKTAYILVYSEAKKHETLLKRFKTDWPAALGPWSLIKYDSDYDDEWAWGIALFRYEP